MRLKYLGEFNDIEIEDKGMINEPFLDAHNIVGIIYTGEVTPPQAHPEDTLRFLKVR